MGGAALVDAYLGLGSRYSYLASTQLDRIAAETGATFTWIPIVSPDLYPTGRNPFEGPPVSGQYDWNYRKQDARAWAEFYRVPFREPAGRLQFEPRELVLGALAADRWQARAATMKRLFAAVFIEDRIRIDRLVLAECAAAIGLDADAFGRAVDADATEGERARITEEAKARGVFGVPFFLVGDRAFFGNDRLVLLEHHLKKLAGSSD
jgi:2-hydroxychromene-2-carboxylate isomerase